MKWLRIFQVTRHGVWFPYKGDEVLYTLPWFRRNREHRFLSLLCHGGFTTLLAIDYFWMSYELAERRHWRKYGR